MARKSALFAPEAAYCRVDLVMSGEHAILMELELIEPLLHLNSRRKRRK